MSNPFFTATSFSNYLLTDTYAFAQLGGSSGTIMFNDSYIVYFTVIGGGGGGGGGGHNNGLNSPEYPSGGGGGAGAGGMISYPVEPGKTYTYTIGTGGSGGEANLSGGNGLDTDISFSGTDYVISRGGTGGAGHYSGNIGGVGGSIDNSGVTTIIDGSGGNGGDGVSYTDISGGGTGTPGDNSTPPVIEISPTNTIYVGGGGGGTDALSVGNPPTNASNGGGGGNGSGGEVGTGIATGTSYNGNPGIAYGAGGGGGGQPGSNSPVVDFNITYGGPGKEGAIFLYFEFVPPNGCQWNPLLANQSEFWTRGTGDCPDLEDVTMPDGSQMTFEDLSEKRKATIFQYKKNNAGFSKKQIYSRLARGIGKQRGASFATQSATYSNPNIRGLQQDGSGILISPSTPRNWALTNQNDTPGPLRRITNYPTVPLYNYIPRRTYLAGGTKWPQFAWAPGMNGFPVGKKGKK